jgi:dTDP-4-amino-4,6-dideoxygalactose transaminase
MADMERLVPICRSHSIVIIEDAAEAAGTFYNTGAFTGKMAGTIGDYGAYSFNGNKIITTGGGGMISSPVSGRVRHMRHLATQAKTDEIYYFHDEVGFNYRMTNIQAAIGLGQLEQLETFIKIKQANYNLYRENGLELLTFRDNCRSNYWFYSYLCPKDASENAGGKRLRDELIRRLSNLGIQTRPIWGLCHEQPMYAYNRAYRIEKAIEYYSRVVNLPCSTNLTAADVCLVAEEITTFVKNR